MIDDDDALRQKDCISDARISVACDEITETLVQILDVRNGNRVVTVIEFVSPSNKLYKAARESYKSKQGEYLAGRSNLVEVDLTRAGKRELLVQDFDIPDSKRGEYLVSVFRANINKYGRREGYGLRLRERRRQKIHRLENHGRRDQLDDFGKRSVQGAVALR